MSPISELAQLLERVSPELVGRLLRRLGYSNVFRRPGYGDVYRLGGIELIVPTNPDLSDYGQLVADVVKSVVPRGMSLDDVLGLLSLPESDILRYRIADELSLWGTLQGDYAAETVPALFDVLRFTAAGVSSRRPAYTDIPPDAKQFAQSCRLGQTERGSFVFKLFCPINPLNHLPTPGEEPYGRVVTRAATENLAFLMTTEDVGNPNVPLPATMNRNVAGALARLQPPSDFARSEVSVWFSAAGQPGETQRASVELENAAFRRAQDVVGRLERVPQIEEELLRGYVVDLHKDRPRRGAEISRQITLEMRFGGGWRKITMVLLPMLYRDAVRWHEEDRQVTLRAILDKRSSPWSVVNMIDFSAVGPVEIGDLFDVDQGGGTPPAG